MKKNIVFIVVILLASLFIYSGHQIATSGLTIFEGKNDTPVIQAIVTDIVDRSKNETVLSETDTFTNETIIFSARVLYGEHKGDPLTAYQNLNTYTLMQLKAVAVGDKVILYNYPDEELGTEWSLGEYQRTDYLVKIGLIFAALLIFFGRRQGLNTLVSLIFTLLGIFIVFIPAVLSGQNIYIWSLVICVYIIVMTHMLISGFNLKSACAAIGCFGGILLSAIMTQFFNHSMHLTGFIDEDSAYLMFINPDHPIDLRGIIFAAILIGAMGAIMDVAMSIASSLHELKIASPELTGRQLFKSGLAIGRDIMGTMSNTLILAYIGGSLSFVLLIVSFNASLIDVLNREVIVTEILQALIGSLGILFTIPLTALLSAFLYSKYLSNDDKTAD